MYVHLRIRSFNFNFRYMASRIHTRTRDLQCSHASVGLAEARPNNGSKGYKNCIHACMLPFQYVTLHVSIMSHCTYPLCRFQNYCYFLLFLDCPISFLAHLPSISSVDHDIKYILLWVLFVQLHYSVMFKGWHSWNEHFASIFSMSTSSFWWLLTAYY